MNENDKHTGEYTNLGRVWSDRTVDVDLVISPFYDETKIWYYFATIQDRKLNEADNDDNDERTGMYMDMGRISSDRTVNVDLVISPFYNDTKIA